MLVVMYYLSTQVNGKIPTSMYRILLQFSLGNAGDAVSSLCIYLDKDVLCACGFTIVSTSEHIVH